MTKPMKWTDGDNSVELDPAGWVELELDGQRFEVHLFPDGLHIELSGSRGAVSIEPVDSTHIILSVNPFKGRSYDHDQAPR